MAAKNRLHLGVTPKSQWRRLARNVTKRGSCCNQTSIPANSANSTRFVTAWRPAVDWMTQHKPCAERYAAWNKPRTKRQGTDFGVQPQRFLTKAASFCPMPSNEAWRTKTTTKSAAPTIVTPIGMNKLRWRNDGRTISMSLRKAERSSNFYPSAHSSEGF
jgi:hypothetical protein